MAEEFRIEPATVDQAAAALALLLGAVGSLLLILWQSRCLCRCRLGVSDSCYLFDCTREPLDPEKADEEPQPERLLPDIKKGLEPEPEPEPEPEQP
jgi:hypothetical protein